MKRFLLLCAIIIAIFACDKETGDPVYDTHLFAQLRAHNWVFDSARITDSLLHDTAVYATPDTTIKQVASFGPQYYTINTLKDTMVFDSTTLTLKDTAIVRDTTAYQITYNNPNTIYYYYVGGQVLLNQYLTIDTVNEQRLILNGVDTLKNISVNYYHVQ